MGGGSSGGSNGGGLNTSMATSSGMTTRNSISMHKMIMKTFKALRDLGCSVIVTRWDVGGGMGRSGGSATAEGGGGGGVLLGGVDRGIRVWREGGRVRWKERFL